MSTEPPERLAASRILPVTEEELQRIVLDIHDGPVQKVFAAMSQIALLQKQLNRAGTLTDVETARQLEQVAVLLGAALHEIRTFVGIFHTPNFRSLSLVDALQDLILQHETFTDCEVVFELSQEEYPVTLPTKIALYRICQEGLTNSYRHSGTTRQEVRLYREGSMIALRIRDWGKGFTPPPLHGPTATERAEHIGLRGMRERVGLVGGTLELYTAPGQGVTIVVQVPPATGT